MRLMVNFTVSMVILKIYLGLGFQFLSIAQTKKPVTYNSNWLFGV